MKENILIFIAALIFLAITIPQAWRWHQSRREEPQCFYGMQGRREAILRGWCDRESSD